MMRQFEAQALLVRGGHWAIGENRRVRIMDWPMVLPGS